MKHLDKFLMVLLIVGVWALVLKPTSITAHSGMFCSISGVAFGNVTGNTAETYEWGGVSVTCL
tara:strand:- start:324 stop:512 length:189 start_codon:yes stop_codon:yes gene_type:complete